MGVKHKIAVFAICYWLSADYVITSAAQQQHDSPQHRTFPNGSGEPNDSDNLPKVNLKHRRYKSIHNISHDASSSSHAPRVHHTAAGTDGQESYEHAHVIHDHEDHHDDHHLENPKAPRSGISLQKAPPDLQFGLAFTVPFVSLSTEKLLNSVSGKNYDSNSVSSLLKLNFSGLLLAALVGLLAAAGLFLPSFLHHGGLTPPWLDSIFPNFGDHGQNHQYNDYENGWGSKWGKEFGKEFNSGRRSRSGFQNSIGALGMGLFKMLDKFKVGVGKAEKCVVHKVCSEKLLPDKDRKITNIMKTVRDNEVLKDVGFLNVVGKVIDGGSDAPVCEKVKGACDGFDDFDEILTGLLSSWGAADSNATSEGGDKDKKV